MIGSRGWGKVERGELLMFTAGGEEPAACSTSLSPSLVRLIMIMSVAVGAEQDQLHSEDGCFCFFSYLDIFWTCLPLSLLLSKSASLSAPSPSEPGTSLTVQKIFPAAAVGLMISVLLLSFKVMKSWFGLTLEVSFLLSSPILFLFPDL